MKSGIWPCNRDVFTDADYVAADQFCDSDDEPNATGAAGAVGITDGPAVRATAGPAAGTTAGSARGTTAGSAAGTTPGSAAGTTAGSAAGTTAGSAAGTTARPAAGTTARPAAGTTAGSADGTTAGPIAGTTAGSADGTTAGPSGAAGAVGITVGPAAGTAAGRIVITRADGRCFFISLAVCMNDWSRWVRRFERFREASGLSTKLPAEQVNTLVYCMGEEADDILTSLHLTEDENGSYEVVKQKFDTYFNGSKNVIF